MTSIFLPLRSNGAWFSNAEARTRLERQIKVNLILYDKLLVQDGRYRVTAGADGQGMSILVDYQSIGESRTEITYYTGGAPFGVSFGRKQVMRSVCDIAYDVDYYPILHEAGLVNADCIEWLRGDLERHYKDIAKQQANADAQNEDLKAVLPENRYLQKEIVQGLYIDAIIANDVGMPFSVDYHAAPVIAWKQKHVVGTWQYEPALAFFDCWLYFDFPDFSQLSWDEVRRIRESSAGRDFRKLVDRICARLESARVAMANPGEVHELVRREFTLEIIEELINRRMTATDALINLGLNLVPFGIVPSTVGDLAKLYQEATSWVTLIEKK